MNTTSPDKTKDKLSKNPIKNFAVGIIVMIIFLIGHSLFAQVGVGNTNPQAQLDISASNTTSPTNQDGILIPRVVNLPANGVMTSAQDGMLVFYDNTSEDGKGFYYWDDTANDWIKIASGTISDDWAISGNSINTNNFLGTTNNQPIKFRTNNTQRMILDIDGDLGINQNFTSATLDIGFTDGKNVIEATGNYTSIIPTTIVSNISGPTLANSAEINNGMTQSFTTTYYGELNYIQFYARGSNNGNQDTRIIIRRNGAVIYSQVFSISYTTSSLMKTVNFPTGIPITTGFNYTVEIEDVDYSWPSSSIYGYFSTSNTYNNGNASGNAPTSGDLALRVNINREVSSTGNVFVLNDDGQLSIGHANPSATLDVVGNFQYVDGNQSSGNILVSDNNGNAGWSDPTTVFTDTDDQNLTSAILTGTTLNLAIENGTGASVNLAALQDGTGTDDQNLTSATLTGTTLNLAIENGTGASVNLAALQDGTGTDDQNLTSATLTGTTLNLDIENGTGASVNLAALQDGTGTDDQNIQNLGFNTSTNILTVGIENGTAQTVNLSTLDNTGNDWSINGNSGTNPTTNFIGTTDNQDLAFRTNNVEKVRITAKGQIETTQLQSVWIGENAGNSVTSGTRNTLVGRNAGTAITTGLDNTAIGGLTLSNLSTGVDNTSIGLGALLYLQNGNGNTFVGEQSGENLATGNYNTVLGHLAGENMNGSANIFIGYQAGNSTTGSNKLIIDNSDDGTNSFIYGEMDNEILRANAEVQVIRNSTSTISHLDLIETTANDGSRLKFSNSTETTNNWLLYGRADNTDADSRLNIFYSGSGNIIEIYGDNTVELNGQLGVNLNNPTYAIHLPNNPTIGTGQGRANAWTTYSDSRVKSNQQQIENGLAIINKMVPKTYFHHSGNIKNGILNITDNGEHTLGFIAQELYEILPEAVQKPEDENESLWSINYDKVIPVTVKAIQELNKKIETLETENAKLKTKLNQLEALEARVLALENNNSSNVNNTTED